MDENELRDALMRGHESLYATSPTFRAHLDYLVALLPLWVRGIATEAESVRGEEYKAYTQMLRSARPIRVELADSLEGWGKPPQTTREQDVALDRLIGRDITREEWEDSQEDARRAEGAEHVWGWKYDWRKRAEENGVMDCVRERVQELMEEESPSAEEFDHTMWLYRQGWNGDPATLQDYERDDDA